MKSSQFENQGIKINYYQTGEGLTDIFLQHGMYDDGLCWGNLPRDLGINYRVTSMDARGFGLSSKPDDGYNIETMTEDMAALIKHLNLNQPVVIGQSMGASLGCHLAAMYPDLLKGVVMIDPAFREPTSVDSKTEFLARRVSELGSQQDLSREEMISIIRSKHPDWPDEFVLPGADSRFRMSLNTFAIFNSIDTTWKEDLKIADCTMLLVTADVNLGAIVSKETAAYVRSVNANVQSVFISGAGHSIHKEKYAEVREAIENFLAEIK